jgi:hypothetical protein
MGTFNRFSLVVAIVAVLFITAPSFATAKNNKRKTSLAVTRSEAKEAEARLAEMGYPTGKVDGVIDSSTRSGLILVSKVGRAENYRPTYA